MEPSSPNSQTAIPKAYTLDQIKKMSKEERLQVAMSYLRMLYTYREMSKYLPQPSLVAIARLTGWSRESLRNKFPDFFGIPYYNPDLPYDIAIREKTSNLLNREVVKK